MKKLLSIPLATVLCFGLSIPASAAAEDSLPAVNETEIVSTKEMFVNHPEFLSDAIITKTELDNNTYSFDFATQEEVPLSDSETKITQQVAKVIAFSEDEAEDVEASIQANLANKTNPVERTCFGGSLYMQSYLEYVTMKKGSETYYKMTRMVTKATVRDGTVLKSRVVNFFMNGKIPSGQIQNKNASASVVRGTNGVYYAAAPSAWSECKPSGSGSKLGGTYNCTVRRASGSDNVFSLNNYVFK